MNLDGYEVTKYGSIISHKYGKPYIMTPSITSKGYKSITLNNVKHLVHRVVMYVHGKDVFHFHNSDFEINHINEIPHDNSIDNLQWATHEQNMKYSYHKQYSNTIKSNCVMFTDDEETLILKLLDLGETVSDINRMWIKYRRGSITYKMVNNIIKKRSA